MAVAVIDQAGGDVGLFAGEAVEVGVAERAGFGEEVAEGVIEVLGDDVVGGIDHHADVDRLRGRLMAIFAVANIV